MQWKVEGSITICPILKINWNNVEGGWTLIYKMSLLQLVETEEIFSR